MEAISLTDPPFFKIIRNPRYSRNTLLYFPFFRTKPRAILVPLYLQFLLFHLNLGIPLVLLLIPYLWYLLFSSLLMILCYTIRHDLSTHFFIILIIFSNFPIFRQIIAHFDHICNYAAFAIMSKYLEGTIRPPLPAHVPHDCANAPEKGGPV